MSRLSKQDIDRLIHEVERQYGIPSRTVRDLTGKYTLWHKKPIKSLRSQRFDFPKSVYRAGRAVSIVYSSDKWEKDGDFYNYVHDFSSGPAVFRTTPKSGPTKDTRDLLRVDSLDETIPMVALARVVELTVENQHEKWPITFARPPILATLLDMKTLVILHRQPIFITGGNMRVRAPGIVK